MGTSERDYVTIYSYNRQVDLDAGAGILIGHETPPHRRPPRPHRRALPRLGGAGAASHPAPSLEGEAAVGELARSAKLSQANTSKHLALLLAARFVARRADGTSAVYRIDDPSIAKMCEVACDGFAAKVAADAKTMKPR